MDIFETGDSAELTPEQKIKMHALTCASRLTEKSVGEGAYSREVLLASDQTLVIADKFYKWIMNG